jgi:hypothetical protein
MSEDNIPRIARKPSRINLNEEDDVKYWTYKLGCSSEQLKTAVGVVGSNLTAITGYFAEQRNNPRFRDVA